MSFASAGTAGVANILFGTNPVSVAGLRHSRARPVLACPTVQDLFRAVLYAVHC